MLKPGMIVRWYTWPEDGYIIVNSIDGDKIYPVYTRHQGMPYYHHPEKVGPAGWIVLGNKAANIKGEVKGYGHRKNIPQ